jgi:hypothetical protein
MCLEFLLLFFDQNSFCQSGDGSCSKVFVLEDDEETRKMWNERY